MKKYTAKNYSGRTVVVTAKNKKEALQKLRVHLPETKLADVILH